MSESKRRPISAKELIAQLRKNPDWVRRNEERECKHRAAVAQTRAELKPEQDPILLELAEVGHPVSSVWDLVNAKVRYPAAIPVLTKYLRLARHPVLLEGIARALSVPEAKGAPAREVLRELQRRADEPRNGARWALGNALSVIGDTSMKEQIEAMLVDPRYQDLYAILQLVLKKIVERSSNS